ncbi:MAG TPA: hypothetical protein VNA69_09595 [Thermoanaerobaculia bacterium]|nr:hypothetical protein [Thermoanaerobaculia bacterium]
MNGDTILHWMTHLAEGSWQAFKDAVALMSNDTSAEATQIRYHLSGFGHVDFFVDGSRRWRVLPPMLAGLAHAESAVLIGGRTPALEEALASAADLFGCTTVIEPVDGRPSIIRVVGDRFQMRQIAGEVGIPFSADHAYALCSDLRPVPRNLDRLPLESPPTNWSVRSFDFKSMSMVDGLHRNSACEFAPRHGLPRWYLHTKQQRLAILSKREAIYAAAALRGIPLLTYDAGRERIVVPKVTLPPETMVRVACLCSGRRPRVERDRVVFDDVPQQIGSLLCVAAGQPLPQPVTSAGRVTGQ